MIPIRTCMICRKKQEKSNLIRIVSKKETDNVVAVFDKDQKANSRALYICKNINCIDKCLKLMEKNKFVSKISVSKDSLKEVLNKIKDEMGEKSWEN